MTDNPAADKSEEARRARLTWRKLLGWSAIWCIVVVVLVNVFGGFVPPLLAFIVLWIIGALWLRRSARGPAILLLVAFIGFLASSAPFIAPTLAVPAAAGDFVLNMASILGALVGIVAAIAVLARRRGADTPRKVVLAGALCLVAATVVSVIALLNYQDASARDDDIELVTSSLSFSDTTLEVDSEEVGVFVTNDDLTLHTFTIDELDVNLAVPGGKSGRVSFQAEPGTYTFYCVPHEYDMKGKLEVR